MAGAAKSEVRRRLWSLAVLELVNIPLHAWVWFVVVGFPASLANLLGFGLCGLLLLQGAGYWLAKLRQLKVGGELPGRRLFAVFRRLNPLLLAGGVGVVLGQTAGSPGAATIPGLVFALFAVLEQVNYFHLQLAHDTRADLRRLFTAGPRRSHLARDLARAGRTARRRAEVSRAPWS